MSRTIPITAVLCTRNRGQQLACTLAAFESIRTQSSWEFVIVDNGSTDNTSDVIAQFIRRGALPLRSVFEPKPGLSAARNAGLREARGEIICYTDDDCYPAHDWIDCWLHAFRSRNMDYGGGRVDLFDPTDAPITIRSDSDPQTFSPRSYIPAGRLHGANMAFRRHLITRVGDFDERLGAGSRFYAAEDTDYFQRASDMGFAGAYCPEPVVSHHHGRKLAEMRLLQRGYEISSGALYAKRLLHNRAGILHHIADWWSKQASIWDAIKFLYWAERRNFLRRNWNISRGLITYLFISWQNRKDAMAPTPVDYADGSAQAESV
ncbi:MAG: glycosyltransferase family 2 protein [Acetobacteraceae bacterium]|nr:glycosyltransferase family 2 protein [Acetobacteraceae bacterium]